MQNKGAGIALNTFSIISIIDLPVDKLIVGERAPGFKSVDLPVILCSRKLWFLVPDKEETFQFQVQEEVSFSLDMFEGVVIFPQVGARLMVTYDDIFSNKYFAVFDYTKELGWKHVYEIRRVKQRLDELVNIRHEDE